MGKEKACVDRETEKEIRAVQRELDYLTSTRSSLSYPTSLSRSSASLLQRTVSLDSAREERAMQREREAMYNSKQSKQRSLSIAGQDQPKLRSNSLSSCNGDKKTAPTSLNKGTKSSKVIRSKSVR